VSQPSDGILLPPETHGPATASREALYRKRRRDLRGSHETSGMTMTTVLYRGSERHMGTDDRHGSGSLSPDTIAQGVRRLGWLALVYAIGNITGPFARLLLAAVAGRMDSSEFGIPDMFGLTTVIMAFGVFAAVRRGTLSSKRLLDLGLVFLVFGALGIAVPEFWHGLTQSADGWFLVPGECVWIVAYPLLVPNTPRKILAASLLAASMGPAGLAISATATGLPVGRLLDTAAYFLTSSYLCAIFAYVIARVVHRVNLQLKDADEIGSYALIEQIGAGGMGEVWQAQHRLLARPAAIKLIRGSMLGESPRAREELARRFEREARETAALRSTHTIEVYDFGVTNEGDFYYVMELLEGLSLERLVQEFGVVEPARTVYLLQQVCHSLGEAHGRGLVHRDVKPANIFVCQLGPDDDFVKVLDFGLVKHTGAGQTVTMLSTEGNLMGTPGYMAPEIALGRADVDGRADVYSLGCVAYYMLTGQPVFSGDTPVVTALAHVHRAPIPPRLRSEATIPSALDALIMECLAKDPAARPASTAVLSERLAATVLAHAWTPDAARTWWESHQPLRQSKTPSAGAAVDDRIVHDVVRLRRGAQLRGAAVRPLNAG
jgi:serine/threonine-protein kinase